MLAYFEKDPSRKSKMYKRRVDLLLPVEEVISPAVYGMQSKQLAWELSEIHDAMFDFKLHEEPNPDPPRCKKLVSIAMKSVFMLESNAIICGYIPTQVSALSSSIDSFASAGSSGSASAGRGSRLVPSP